MDIDGISPRMLEAGFYNMDCMDGMAQFPDKFFELAIVDLKRHEPVIIPLNVGKVSCACAERLIDGLTHSVNGCNGKSHFLSNFRLRHLVFERDNRFIIADALFIIVSTAQRINAKVNGFWHILRDKITNLAGVKAHKREQVNFLQIIPCRSVFTMPLDVENVRKRFNIPLRNNARGRCGFDLNPQKFLAVIHENVIGKSLFTWKRYKPFHNQVSTSQIFPRLTYLEFITKSHTITSPKSYNKYVELSTARYKAVSA